MSLKQNIFEYLKNNPGTDLDSLAETFSDQNRSTIRKYFYDYKKTGSGEKKSPPPPAKKNSKGQRKTKSAKSMRQLVFDHMTSHPDATIDDLCQAIPGGSRKTVRDYRNKWISQSNRETGHSQITQKKIFDYLNENPAANLNDLKKNFVGYKKLVTDFRSWKQQQTSQPKPGKSPESSDMPEGTVPVESDKQKIRLLNEIIVKQRQTIEKQKQKIRQITKQLSGSNKLSLSGIRKYLVDKLLKK